MLLALAIFLLVGCESTSNKEYDKEGFKAKFGVMVPNKETGKFHIYAETTLIHRDVSPRYVHGFEVWRRDRQRFLVHFEIRFPEPITISEEIEKAYTVSEGGRVIRSEPSMEWAHYSAPFWFSEDDPLGTYSLTVFIDGDPYRTFEYEVVPFGVGEEEFDF